jgi:hypothetical protein
MHSRSALHLDICQNYSVHYICFVGEVSLFVFSAFLACSSVGCGHSLLQLCDTSALLVSSWIRGRRFNSESVLPRFNCLVTQAHVHCHATATMSTHVATTTHIYADPAHRGLAGRTTTKIDPAAPWMPPKWSSSYEARYWVCKECGAQSQINMSTLRIPQ